MNSVFNNIKHFPMEFHSSSVQNDIDHRGSLLWGNGFDSGLFSKVSKSAELSDVGNYSEGECRTRFGISTYNKIGNLVDVRCWEGSRFQPVGNHSCNSTKNTQHGNSPTPIMQVPLTEDEDEDDPAFINPRNPPSASQYELIRTMRNFQNLKQLYRARYDVSVIHGTSQASKSKPIHFQTSKFKQYPVSHSEDSAAYGYMKDKDFKEKCPNTSSSTKLLQASSESDNHVLTYDARWTFGPIGSENVENDLQQSVEALDMNKPTSVKYQQGKTSPLISDASHLSRSTTKTYPSAEDGKPNYVGLEVKPNSSCSVYDMPKSFSIVNSEKGKGQMIMFRNNPRSTKASINLEQNTFGTSVEDQHIGITSKKKEIDSGTLIYSPKQWIMSINSPDFSKMKEISATGLANNDKMIYHEDGKPMLNCSFKPKVMGKNHILKSKAPPVIKSINELLLNPYENCECVFCKGNNQTEEVYLSHPIRINEIVVCPYLRNYICAICKATGDLAHTIKYCPHNRRGFFAMRENFPPPKRYAHLLSSGSGRLENHPSIDFKKVKIIQNIWKSKPHTFPGNNGNSSRYHNDTMQYSLAPSTTLTHASSCCCSNEFRGNNEFLQKRATSKKQKSGFRSGCDVYPQ